MQSQPPKFILVPKNPNDEEAKKVAIESNWDLYQAKIAADESNNSLSHANFKYKQLYEQYLLNKDWARRHGLHIAPANVLPIRNKSTNSFSFIGVREPPPRPPRPQPSFMSMVAARLFPGMGGRTKRSKKHSKRSNRKGPKRSSKRHRKHFRA